MSFPTLHLRIRKRAAVGSPPSRYFCGASETDERGWVHWLAVAYPLANALYQWEEGARELAAIDDPRRRRLADRVIEAIRVELRRRIGPTFTAEELAELYGQGTDWAQQVAIDVAPAASDEAQTLADAAFWAYLRNAGNFAGGRSLA
jgi:AcrR family transcriptional regulator